MSGNRAAKRRAFAANARAMEREAGRSKAYSLELYAGDGGLRLLAAAVAGDAGAVERLHAIATILAGTIRACSSCGGQIDYPAVIGLLSAARETPGTRHALGLACCTVCASEGEHALRARLMAFLDGRPLDPTHAAPEAVQ